MTAKKPRIAVLIDAENVPAKLANCLFGKIAHLGRSNVRRLYGNLQKPGLKAWADAASRHHIESRPNGPHAKKKNVTDSTFIIDAMDLLSTGRFDGFCIVSRDSDFAGLAKYMREKGKLVYGIASAPECLRNECCGLIELKPSVRTAPTKPPRA
jgi:NYN domain